MKTLLVSLKYLIHRFPNLTKCIMFTLKILTPQMQHLGYHFGSPAETQLTEHVHYMSNWPQGTDVGKDRQSWINNDIRQI